ncbi:MAG: phosphatidylglycerol lysyltransferase domain-containing protein [Acidimicrobiales bacterium]
MATSADRRSGGAHMAAPGGRGDAVIIGRRDRAVPRSLAVATALVGVLDVVLAAERHPFIGVGKFRVAHRATIEGSRYVLLVSGLTLTTSARQLWRGKHRAWQLALITLMASLIAHPIHNGDMVGVVPTAILATGLVLASARFSARSDPAKASEGVLWLLFGELGVLIYGTAGLFLLDRDFAQENGLGRSISQALRLLFLLPVDAIDTVTRHGDWFVASVRVLALLVLFIAIWHFVQPVVVRNTSDRVERVRARAILEQYATTGIAYFHLLGDKRLFIANDGRALLSYRVVGGTAIALGEPIGAADSCVLLAREFDEFCALNGWRLAYHQVSPAGTRLLEALGYKSIKIGEEAIVPVQAFTLEGSHRKRLRNKNRQLAKEGVIVEELARSIDEATMAELREVSDAWLADGGHRERTFTLGWFDSDYLRDTTVLVARSAGGRVEAFVNLLPAFRGTAGNFDLMRRRPDAPNGVMDFLFVHLIERFRAQGLTGMTLGFAPLVRIEGDGLVARVLRILYESDNKAFNFKGLHDFKSKWDPMWEPRTLVYRSDLELPQIAYAVARVGEKVESAPRFLRAGLHN